MLTLALAACGSSKHAATRASSSGCESIDAPPTEQRHVEKPTKALDPTKTYDVTMQTSCGSFVIGLAVKSSPNTTASFVSLVRVGFFDKTTFHRIVPGFIIQGGDPTATGTGGPGYKTVDPPPASTRYTFGLVAMGKTQTEAPGTSGSQFFVVTSADAGLPADYAVLGRLVSGAAVVRRIGRLGDPSTERPTQTVELMRATVSVT